MRVFNILSSFVLVPNIVRREFKPIGSLKSGRLLYDCFIEHRDVTTVGSCIPTFSLSAN